MKFKEYLAKTPKPLDELSMTRGTKIDKRETGDFIELEIRLETDDYFFVRITKFNIYPRSFSLIFGEKLSLKPLPEDNVLDKWVITFQDSWRSEKINPKEKGVALQLFAAIEKSLTDLIKARKPHVLNYETSDSAPSRKKLYDTLAKRIEKSGKYKYVHGKSGKYYFVRRDLIA
jgi:hypothetical protein